MNIHPIFVHFPVALLTVYSVFELIRFRKLNNSSEWFYIKAVLLIVGAVGLLPALLTGDLAQKFHRDVRQLVHAHEFFAQLTTIIFGLLAINYLILVCDKLWGPKLLAKFGRLWAFKLKVRNIIFKNWVVILLAIIGFISLAVTGALGGAIAYGSNVDPLATWLVRILHIQ